MAGKGNVAILEDDSTMANALKAAFNKEGFEVFVSGKPDLVRDYVTSTPVNALFVDCLLPGVSGMDFVQELRKKFPPQALDVVMMSGLFTDSAFIKDALRSTKAIAFLTKPFDLKDALACVKPNLDHSEGASAGELPPRRALYQIFNKVKVTDRDKRKAIEALDFVHGFDLPFIYSLLVETGASGHLNMVNQKGDVFGVSFAGGDIVGVDIADQETQLGKLLIQAGYLLPDDLQEALNLISTKRLGERLIQGNYLSPHAFSIALANQMTIRISRTVINEELKVNFVASEVATSIPSLDSNALVVFLHDWIASKINQEWLKANFTHWASSKISKGPNYLPTHTAFTMPLISTMPGFVEFVLQGKTLNQILEEKRFTEESVFKALHFMLAKGILIFTDDSTATVDPNERFKSLTRMSAQFEGKQIWEIIDLMYRIAGVPEGDAVSMEFEIRKVLGGEPGAANKDLQVIWTKLKAKIDEAAVIAKSGDKEKIKEEAAQAELHGKMKVTKLFEEAKQMLIRMGYPQAYGLLKQINESETSVLDRYALHMIWAKLGIADTNPAKKAALIKEVEGDLLGVPPEDRFDALYSFILGMLYKVKGELLPAKKSIEKALNLDATMVAARRELNQINQLTVKSTHDKDINFGQMINKFFKKAK